MTTRYFPLERGRIITSPFGPRSGGFHAGVDFGWPGGSANKVVYAVQAGTVIYAGAAQGYGLWAVIDSDQSQGGGCLEYGHIVPDSWVKPGARVEAGQRIGYINPNRATNGGVDPHLHLSDMPGAYDPKSKQDPMKRLQGAQEVGQAPTPPAPPPATEGTPMQDPFTGAIWSPNKSKRSRGNPRWIAIHTQEGNGNAESLGRFLANPSSQVSYHAVCDDHKLLKIVGEGDRPWSAANANDYAFHLCLAGSYAGWSRGKWLETDARDGKNEDQELSNAAKIVAWWCNKYRIPPVWIGNRNVPPWGLEGICGHKDFGTWGGGHHDPGPNFPVDEFIRRVNAFLGGSVPAPLPNPVPVGPGGGNPVTDSKYANILLYRGRPGNDPALVKKVQQRLKSAYAAYSSHLAVDGDYGPQTEAAVREFQRRSGLTADGIVGPQTAAALKLKV